uniref:Uncharacterized protein n=1 Tax=Arundo donax TaxID=35708 RepID=A0A0A9GUJ6_ARUDO
MYPCKDIVASNSHFVGSNFLSFPVPCSD